MAGRYALLSRDPYSNQKSKGPLGRQTTTRVSSFEAPVA